MAEGVQQQMGVLKCALIGSPVAHSLSPLVQAEAARLCGLRMSYELREVEPGCVSGAVHTAQTEGLRGLNVTTPHKIEVLKDLDSLETAAAEVGAVNTILFDSDRRHGFNTDYSGARKLFLDLLPALASDCETRPGLIFGSGPAARAAALALKDIRGPIPTIITRDSSAALSAFATKHGLRTMCAGTAPALSALNEAAFVINATPLGSSNYADLSPFPANVLLADDSLLMDLNYSPAVTLTMSQASQLGNRVLNGAPWLAYQAADSFNIWTGIQINGRQLLAFLQTQGLSNALPDSR